MYYSCLRCNRPLKNPRYREIGYGKICFAKAAAERDRAQNSDNFLHDEAGNPDIVLRRVDHMAKTNVQRALTLHSPTGFEWGYGGSGPADLALNILVRFGLSEFDATNLHQDFKWKFIAPMPAEGGVIRASEIACWVAEQRKAA